MRNARQSLPTCGSPGLLGWAIGSVWFAIMTVGPVSYWGLNQILIQPPAFLAMLSALAAFPALGWLMCAGAWRSAWTTQRQIETLEMRFDRIQIAIETLSAKLEAANVARSTMASPSAPQSKSSRTDAPSRVSRLATDASPCRQAPPSQSTIWTFSPDVCRASQDIEPANGGPDLHPTPICAPQMGRRRHPAATPTAEPAPARDMAISADAALSTRAAKRRQRRNRAKLVSADQDDQAPTRMAGPLAATPAATSHVYGAVAPAAEPPLSPAVAYLWSFWPTPAPQDYDRSDAPWPENLNGAAGRTPQVGVAPNWSSAQMAENGSRATKTPRFDDAEVSARLPRATGPRDRRARVLAV
ncbi:MAG: hypothetical protein KJS97_01610 [Alphaproteobacteria bacterium]|nr:hypothetical protein [Alphaproteobacteria bacterium]